MVQLHLLCTIFLSYSQVRICLLKPNQGSFDKKEASQCPATSSCITNVNERSGTCWRRCIVHRWGCCCFILPHAFSGEKMATKYSSHLQGQGTNGSKSKGTIYIYNSCIRFCLLSVFPSSCTPSLCLNFWSYTLENQSMTLPWGPLVDSCRVAGTPWWRATTTKFFTFAAPRTCVVESPAGNGLAWGISCVDMDTKNFQDLNSVGICWLPLSWGWTNILQVATSFHHLFAHLWTSHNHHVITPATHRFNKHLLNPHLHQLSSIP